MRRKRVKKTLCKSLLRYRRYIMMLVLLVVSFCLGIYKYDHDQRNLKIKSQSVESIKL